MSVSRIYAADTHTHTHSLGKLLRHQLVGNLPAHLTPTCVSGTYAVEHTICMRPRVCVCAFE